MKTFYLTTPLYYPNARPHVGSAYTTIVCDVIARYKRMCGYDVAYLTGTDEHGEKLERAARAEGMSPSEFVAAKRQLFVEVWKKLGIEYSHFVYTDQPDHVTSVQRIMRRAKERNPGVIYKKTYEGRYCVSDERYISDGTEPANCDICGRPAELISEENYFFKLSAFQDRLLELYEKHPEFVQPDFRRNEVLSFVKSGLRDISVSRKRIKWGIPWPDDPEQVFYVWYDALTGYLTGLGYAQGANGGPDYQKYWADSESEVVHMIGKDILRFHAVYWPAFLLAADMPLPKMVFAHGWIYYEQDKMSKSKGNVVYPEPIIDALESFGAPGNDALRYYLLREAPFGQDTSFSYDALIQRFNSDLANDLGNLASRTITMINRYFGGEVPHPKCALTETEESLRSAFFGERVMDGDALITERSGLTSEYISSFGAFDLSTAVGYVWHLISGVNKYLVEKEPWKLAESGREEDRALLALVLYTAADLLRTTTIMLYPIMPKSSKRLWEQLGCKDNLGNQKVADLKWAALEAGTKVGKPEPVFPRLDKEKTLAKLYGLAEADRERGKSMIGAVREPPLRTQHEKPKEKKSMDSDSTKSPSPESRASSPAAEKISIEDFAKVEMRVGEVKSAEPVQGAQKLTKLQVDIGSEVRQVVAGIAEYYKPEQIVGMKVVIVTNLQPRKLRGVESNGMIVAASVGPEGKPVLVTFKEDVPNGARLK
jgi:methionyl-tRNA synthetase